MATLTELEECFDLVSKSTGSTALKGLLTEVISRLINIEADLCVLAARDVLINDGKWEIVDFPILQSSPGEPGQLAVNADQAAFYIEGEGWKFATLTNTIL